MSPAHIAIPDQIIDYSYGREHTFFAENLAHVTHIDFTHPYSLPLRSELILAAQKRNYPLVLPALMDAPKAPDWNLLQKLAVWKETAVM